MCVSAMKDQLYLIPSMKFGAKCSSLKKLQIFSYLSVKK